MSPIGADAARLDAGHRHALPDGRRAPPGRLQAEVTLLAASPIVSALLDVSDSTLLVLNAERQIVAMNGGFRRRPPAGLRPGELLSCANAAAPGGCGTSQGCGTCGALGAILGCQRTGAPVTAACHLVTDRGGAALELAVRAAPVTVENARFTVLSLRDVTAARRREALEQVFFHDVMNTVTGMRGWASLARHGATDLRQAAERIDALSRQLEREIRDHRTLVLAEEGTLVPLPSTVRVADLLREVTALFEHHECGRGRTVDVAVPPALELDVDPALLARVLINMVRNALEATPRGGTVRVTCDPDPAGASVRFEVHNPGAIPPEDQPRIFQRSFSTKGRGRGLGTYGMKLLGEGFLGGAVSFASSAEAGTVFTIAVPVRPPAPSVRPPPPPVRA